MNSIKDRLFKSFDFIQGNIPVMLVSRSLRMFAIFLVLPFYPFYVLALGGSYISIGIISAVGGVLSIPPSLVGGYLTDKWGRKQFVALLTLLMGPIRAINAFAPTWIYLLLATSILSFLRGFRYPAVSALMADSLRPENRGKGYGTWSGFPMLLGVLAPLISGWMVTERGLIRAVRLGYLIGALAITLGGVLQFFFLTETFQGDQTKASLRENLHLLVKTSREMPKNLKILLLISTLATLAWGLKKRFRATYALEVIGLTPVQWSFLYAFVRGLRILVVPFLGHFVDSIGRRIMLIISLLIIPFTNFVFILSTGIFFASMSYSSFYLSRHLRRTSSTSLRADLSKREKRGKINSIFRILGRPCNRIGVLLGGILYQNLGKSSPFFTESLLFIGLIPLTVFFIQEPKEREL